MIRRVYFMLFKPGLEWAEIKGESPLNPRHFFSYALVFAAVSPGIRFLAGFLYGHYKRPFSGWSWAVVRRELLFCAALYFFSLAMVMLWRRVISLLAPVFSSQRRTAESLVLAVFSMIPYWLGGVFYLIPQTGWIIKIFVGFYGFYILYRGLAANLLETPRKKVFSYLIVSSVLGLGLVVLAEVSLRFLFTAWGVIKLG
jgi:hypothetical protein